ncbi:MAG: hypothetical protein AB1633_07035 [Elusimicrobiota bacterium]
MPNPLNFLFYIILAVISTNACCLEITRFELHKSTGSKIADIKFSKVILVKNIEYKNSSIILPLDIFKDKKYDNIRIVTKEFHDLILKNFSDGKNTKNPAKGSVNCKTPEFKITQIRKLSSPYRIANIEVVFDNSLLVILGIIKSKHNPGDFWISYPDCFEITDKNYKKLFEQQILKEFLKTNGSRNL